MSRHVLALLSASFVVGAAAPASAREDPPPRWGFELGAGPYQPQAGAGRERVYYERIYATEKDNSLFEHRPLLKELELHYYWLTSFGLLGSSLRFGHWSVTAPTRVCGTEDVPLPCGQEDVVPSPEGGVFPPDNSRPGNDRTTLTVLPFGVGLIYRMDLLKRHAPVPLVPYAKAGLDYYLWRNTVGGKVSENDDRRGAGATLGVRAAVGVAFNFDWLEPSAALRARQSVDLADSYFFGEVSRIWADGFGDSTRLDLSTAWFFKVGLALDFD